MDTNSNIPAQKQVVSVEILHLDELGYGPQGKHTRREWRAECLENLLAGAAVFKTWQDSWKQQIHLGLPKVNFSARLKYSDGSQLTVLSDIYNKAHSCEFDFVGQEFVGSLDAVRAQFQLAALFACAKFSDKADFSGSTFSGIANFRYAIFDGASYFSDAIFHGPAGFTQTKFSADAVFDNVIFNGPASFEEARFFKNAWFNSVAFNDYAWFIDALFENVVEFYNATFIFDGKFEDVVFKSDVTFLKAKFHSQGLFKNVNFFGDANFMAVTFQILGLFEEARFHLSAPNFRGCQIDCTRLEFSGQNYFPVYESNSIAVKNYSFLKRLSDEHGQTDQALNFNALELRVKAKQSKEGFWFKKITRGYEIVSDFGRSFAKPLKYYLGLLVVVYILALGNAVVNSPKDCKAENLRMLSDLWRDDTPCDISKTNPDDKTRLNGYRAAAEYTIYRAAGILDFSDNGKATDAVARRLFGQSYEPGWMRFVGLVKAIASTALLFLAALGLRNKYRIK